MDGTVRPGLHDRTEMTTLRNIECVPHFIILAQEPGDSQAREHYFYFVSGRRQVQHQKYGIAMNSNFIDQIDVR